jgi:hypothetical protein
MSIEMSEESKEQLTVAEGMGEALEPLIIPAPSPPRVRDGIGLTCLRCRQSKVRCDKQTP